MKELLQLISLGLWLLGVLLIIGGIWVAARFVINLFA